MYSNSYYAATASPLAEQAPLGAQSIHADVCVVGAGYTGLSSALHLAQRGMSVVVLEARRIASGASGVNGGQLFGGQRQSVDWLEAHYGVELAHRLWELGESAQGLVKRLIADLGIDCDLTPGVAIVAHRQRYVDEYHALVDKLAAQYGRQGLDKLDADQTRALLGTDAYHGGYVDWEAAHLHPLNLALGVARRCLTLGVRICEGTRAVAFDDRERVTVRTENGNVTADYLVIAANAHLGTLAPQLGRHIMPINSFIIATQPLSEALANEINPRRIAVADSRFVVNYFRMTPDRRLLFGGGETYRRAFPRDIARFVKARMTQIYPRLAQVAIDYAWGGTLAVTRNRLPQLGTLSRRVYFAHGYSGQGIALAHLAGRIMAEAIAGETERFDVFAALDAPAFPGGSWLRQPARVLGMLYFALRDRL
jgi:gamma-glutamylputrescine oxidase